MKNTKYTDEYTTTPTLLNSSYVAFAQKGAAKNRDKNKYKIMCVEKNKKKKKQEKEKEKKKSRHAQGKGEGEGEESTCTHSILPHEFLTHHTKPMPSTRLRILTAC